MSFAVEEGVKAAQDLRRSASSCTFLDGGQSDVHRGDWLNGSSTGREAAAGDVPPVVRLGTVATDSKACLSATDQPDVIIDGRGGRAKYPNR